MPPVTEMAIDGGSEGALRRRGRSPGLDSVTVCELYEVSVNFVQTRGRTMVV
jgi:hypothetical protein